MVQSAINKFPTNTQLCLDMKEKAQQMLDNGEIGFWTNGPPGSHEQGS